MANVARVHAPMGVRAMALMVCPWGVSPEQSNRGVCDAVLMLCVLGSCPRTARCGLVDCSSSRIACLSEMRAPPLAVCASHRGLCLEAECVVCAMIRERDPQEHVYRRSARRDLVCVCVCVFPRQSLRQCRRA